MRNLVLCAFLVCFIALGVGFYLDVSEIIRHEQVDLPGTCLAGQEADMVYGYACYWVNPYAGKTEKPCYPAQADPIECECAWNAQQQGFRCVRDDQESGNTACDTISSWDKQTCQNPPPQQLKSESDINCSENWVHYYLCKNNESCHFPGFPSSECFYESLLTNCTGNYHDYVTGC